MVFKKDPRKNKGIGQKILSLSPPLEPFHHHRRRMAKLSCSNESLPLIRGRLFMVPGVSCARHIFLLFLHLRFFSLRWLICIWRYHVVFSFSTSATRDVPSWSSLFFSAFQLLLFLFYFFSSSLLLKMQIACTCCPVWHVYRNFETTWWCILLALLERCFDWLIDGEGMITWTLMSGNEFEHRVTVWLCHFGMTGNSSTRQSPLMAHTFWWILYSVFVFSDLVKRCPVLWEQQ